MYRKILVPLDGSASAEVALPRALELAARTHAALHVVTVADGETEEGVPAKGRPVGPPIDRTELVRAAEDYLEDVGRRIADHSGTVEITGQALPAGNVVSALLNEMTAEDVDLIVVTTNGRGPRGDRWLGSVTDGLARRARRPLLMVRADGPAERSTDALDAPASPLGRILVPLDGSLDAREVLPHARELAGAEGARLSLLSVVADRPPDAAPYGGRGPLPSRSEIGAVARAAREALEEIAAELADEGFVADLEVRQEPHPAVAILDAANEIGADAIAMTTRGRGGAPHLILGRVVDKVVRGARIPVLVHRPRRPEEE